jgi:hypothetical protein
MLGGSGHGEKGEVMNAYDEAIKSFDEFVSSGLTEILLEESQERIKAALLAAYWRGANAYTLEWRERNVKAIETVASCVKDGVLQMRDVDRAKVYGEHLGEKLRGKE